MEGGRIGIEILAFGSALIPAIIWLLFFLKEDIHPEPKRAIFFTFLGGALVSFPVLASQVFFQDFIVSISANQFYLILGLSLIEEFFKFAAVYLIINRASFFDEPIDAMIYMVVAALGFATVENVFIVANSLDIITTASLTEVAGTLSLRFVGATLLHAVSSAIVGFYWAMRRDERVHLGFVGLGLLIATLVHTIFNYLILQFREDNLLYSSLFLVVIAFFVLKDFDELRE